MSFTPPLTTALPNVEADPAAVRIVLFGMPDAGKSSLLGALIQASHVQERILKGRLIDLTNGLAELWRRAYEDRQRETRDEIVPYPVYFEPYPGDNDRLPNLGAILFDCDGRVANDVLAERQSLDIENAGALASALIHADAIILTIDAAAPAEQLQTDFREFSRFLDTIRQRRGQDYAVSAFPIYLALTKCDKLAAPSSTAEEWQQRIAERQKQVRERFHSYFTAKFDEVASFGSLQLQVFPTAVKQAELANAPTQPRAPLGVAELFHDCLHAAYGFRVRTRRADRRLQLVTAATIALLAVAITAAVLFFLIQPSSSEHLILEDRVAQFELHDEGLPERLDPKHLPGRAAALAVLRDNPDFSKIPESQRTFVRARLDEIDAYLKLRENLALVPSPQKARSLSELAQLQGKLEKLTQLAPGFETEWEKAPPPAVVERQQRLKQIAALREAVEQLTHFYAGLKNKGNDRLFDSHFSARWEQAVDQLLNTATHPPLPRDDPELGVAWEFDGVQSAEKDWQTIRKKVVMMRDLAAAASLIRADQFDAAPLAFGPLPGDANLNRAFGSRLAALNKLYPDWPSWSLAALPDPLQGEIRGKLNGSMEQMLEDSRRMILGHYREIRPIGNDTPEDWRQIAAWVESPPLREWRELLGLVSRLLDPERENPVDALSTFLTKSSFDMRLETLTVNIPNQLPPGRLTLAGNMEVSWGPAGTDRMGKTLRFGLQRADTVVGPRRTKYVFILERGDGQLNYKPGDSFSARAGLSNDGSTWEMSWSRPGTATFAFDCLKRWPLLRGPEASEKTSVVDDVTVAVEPRFPALPVLLPNVRPADR